MPASGTQMTGQHKVGASRRTGQKLPSPPTTKISRLMGVPRRQEHLAVLLHLQILRRKNLGGLMTLMPQGGIGLDGFSPSTWSTTTVVTHNAFLKVFLKNASVQGSSKILQIRHRLIYCHSKLMKFFIYLYSIYVCNNKIL